LQRAAKTRTVVFDKTGTITEGRFEIVRLLPVNVSENDLLAVAAAVERASDHPLARIIVEEALRRGLAIEIPSSAQVLPGRGAQAAVGSKTWRAGTAAFVAHQPPAALLDEVDSLGATAVWVADENQLAGAILLRDRLREGAQACTRGLRELDLSDFVMLTGDQPRAAEAIARQAGIDRVEAGLLPEQKLARVREMSAGGNTVAMVGDGINDAPALAAAGIGIAVAGASAITAEAADVVHLPHSLDSLPELFSVSRRAVATAWQNIILFAGVVNVGAVLLAASGAVGPIGAAVTHQLSSFLVMMNSLRLLRVSGPRRHWRWPSIDYRALLRPIVNRRCELLKPALAAAAVLVVLNGIYVIPPEETGIIQRFGRRLTPLENPGIHYKLPWPVDQLTRVQARRVRALEIGFRTVAAASAAEPASYEWNAQHRSGRFQRVPEESLMLTGDQNMIELNASIHYVLDHPENFVFGQVDGESTMRAASESSVQAVVTGAPLDDLLTTGRAVVEQRIQIELQSRLNRYASGVRVLSVRLEDVHPSLEVVDAFRDVSGAFEEKNRAINEAEAYRNEQVALARGNAKASVSDAAGYRAGRVNRAQGDAGRFTSREAAFRSAPGPTETRLYLETIEQTLPGKKKLIVDATKARRQLFLLDDGVEIGGTALNPVFSETPRKQP
jgi:Cu+-exporting ATPase